jgi:hypothetical protein
LNALMPMCARLRAAQTLHGWTKMAKNTANPAQKMFNNASSTLALGFAAAWSVWVSARNRAAQLNEFGFPSMFASVAQNHSPIAAAAPIGKA